ncbi:MAG: TIGR04168 family protein, partial [Prochlorococcaceae cyanobacterium]
ALPASAARTRAPAQAADPALPLVVLSHCGPSGLGSRAADPCGRDWKSQAGDWGDQDLALALEQIRRSRPVPLVVFGHMHHTLRRGQGERLSFCRDRAGTAYLNAACVPRHGLDAHGRALRHFSWVEFEGHTLVSASHRWYGLGGALLYEQRLWQGPSSAASAALEVPSPC